MKKGLVLGLAGLFLLTGCGSKVTCSRTLTQGGEKIEAKIIAKVKSKKIDSIEVVYNTDSKEMASNFCKVYNSAKCSGKKVTFTNKAALDQFGITQKELKETTKDDFVKGVESTGFKCK